MFPLLVDIRGVGAEWSHMGQGRTGQYISRVQPGSNMSDTRVLQVDNITVKIEEPTEGLFGPDELWITVTGTDPLPDFTTIRRLAKQRFRRDDIPVQPLRYYPAWGGPDEPYEELWVVRKRVQVA